MISLSFYDIVYLYLIINSKSESEFRLPKECNFRKYIKSVGPLIVNEDFLIDHHNEIVWYALFNLFFRF